jgi:hypothetical protein
MAFRRPQFKRLAWPTLGIFLGAALATGASYGPALWRTWTYEPREGDLIFQSLPNGPVVAAIEGATHSPWSHCGIVAKNSRGHWIVYEALGEVKATSLELFLMRSRNQRYATYRLRPEHQHHVAPLLQAVRGYLGRPYDHRYQMDDENIYCSELIYKAFHEVTGEQLGELVPLGDLDWQEYLPLIERIEGGPVPVDRQMITPRDLARAKQLELVQGR